MSLIKWFIHYVLGYPNYTIRSVDATYEVVGDPDISKMSPFWASQKLEKGTMKTVNVWGWIWKPVPNCIRIHTLLIHYWYNGTTYTYIPPRYDFEWPPKRTSLKFSVPIKNAVLLDENGDIIVDITKVVKKFIGPLNDLTLFERIRKIKFTNILGVSFGGEVKFKLP